MKFNVQSKALYAKASAVSKVINTKNTMPILNNFLMELRDGQLILTASDLENTLTGSLPVLEVEGEGRFCVDGRRLTDLLKSMPDIGITFAIDDETLAIEVTYNGDKGKFDFVGANADEYPEIEKDLEVDALSFQTTANAILNGIDNTLFAVGTDQLRPQMMGIYLDIKDSELTFVATDARKLVKYVDRNVAPGVSGSCIIPVKPATVLKNVADREQEMTVTIDSKHASFKTEDMEFTCRLLRGNFPDYERVIPKNNPYTLTVDRETFLAGLRRVSVFGDQGQNTAKVRITPDEVTIKAVDLNYCTRGVESMSCDFNHSELVIGFNVTFLMEIFSTITTAEVTVTLSDPSRPGVFRPSEDKEGTELLILLLPISISEF
jgi:DNA polymerase-3 subunit beta